MRLYFAISLPPELRALVEDRRRPLEHDIPARWARLEDLHVTLVFLGERRADELPTLAAALDEVCAAVAPFSLAFKGAGTFGGRVLWLGVTGAVERARGMVASLHERLAVVPEHPEWTPHLTLARARSPRPDPALARAAEALASFESPPFTVSAVGLFESRGGSSRSVHRATLAG